MSIVLDASALLAVVRDEPGAEVVEPLVNGALMSSLNWSEVVQKVMQRGMDVGSVRSVTEAAGLQIVPFDVRQAERAARLWMVHRSAGLSLADRACLALALNRGATVVTTDRAWGRLTVGVPVMLAR